MLKAKLDSVRKNKKGFSLVELIIVIAIMVALIAVMAPSFVKYVQKSRDSALATAAESLYTAMQTYYGDPDEDPDTGVTLLVYANGGESIKIYKDSKADGNVVTGSSAADATDAQRIVDIAGVDTSKTMGKASVYYTLTATAPAAGSTGYTFSMTKATVA